MFFYYVVLVHTKWGVFVSTTLKVEISITRVRLLMGLQGDEPSSIYLMPCRYIALWGSRHFTLLFYNYIGCYVHTTASCVIRFNFSDLRFSEGRGTKVDTCETVFVLIYPCLLFSHERPRPALSFPTDVCLCPRRTSHYLTRLGLMPPTC